VNFAVWTNDDEATVYLQGELDLAVAPDVDVAIQRALRHTPRVLHLDLNAVTFLDSCGIAAIVRGWRCAGPDTTVRLGPAQPSVERVLAITGVRDALAQGDSLPAP
jgi:anti-sigma B factor antagonist